MDKKRSHQLVIENMENVINQKLKAGEMWSYKILKEWNIAENWVLIVAFAVDIIVHPQCYVFKSITGKLINSTQTLLSLNSLPNTHTFGENIGKFQFEKNNISTALGAGKMCCYPRGKTQQIPSLSNVFKIFYETKSLPKSAQCLSVRQFACFFCKEMDIFKRVWPGHARVWDFYLLKLPPPIRCNITGGANSL